MISFVSSSGSVNPLWHAWKMMLLALSVPLIMGNSFGAPIYTQSQTASSETEELHENASKSFPQRAEKQALKATSARLEVAKQEGTIEGEVTNASTGQPIPGVNVTVEELADEGVGTATRGDGTYQIRNVPEGSYTLKASFIGYQTETKTVEVDSDETTVVDFQLGEATLDIDEVVVTGRATSVSRRNLASDVSTVNSADLNRVSSESIDQALQGKIAGGNVQQNSGAPGGGLQVRLRGISTIIGDFKPLYVVDGVIVSNRTLPSGLFQVTASSDDPERGGNQDGTANRIADLNPNDIETIEVLKGASAAAIYGSKASNGVVIITTKSGTSGDTQYNFTQRLGTRDLSNTVGLREFQSREAAVNTFGETAADFWEEGKFIDHEERLSDRNPLMFESSLSANGSIGDTGFYVSGLVTDRPGIINNTGYEKQSVRVNLDQTFGERLSLDLHTNAIRTETARGFTNNDNRNISYWMTLSATPSFIDLGETSGGVYPDNPFSASNPLQTSSLSKNEGTVWRFIGSGEATYDVITGDQQSLEITGLGGVDYFAQDFEIITPPELQFEPDDGFAGTSISQRAFSTNANFSLNAVHQYNFSEINLNATTSVGTQYELEELDLTRLTARGLTAGQTNIDQARSTNSFQSREEIRDQGFYVQEELLYDDRLFITASVRADRSSTNSTVDDFFWYPKTAISYRFEDIYDGVDALKLRLAYGETGNRPRYGQKFTPLRTQNIDGLGSVSVGGVTADPNLQPERQREIEGGLDLTLFDERVSLALTGYQWTTTDVLLERQLPNSSGFTTAIFNGGKLRGRGFEANLEAAPVQTDQIEWRTATNFALSRSWTESLPVPEFEVQGFGFLFGSFVVSEGESLTGMWGNIPTEDGGSRIGKITEARPTFKMGFSNDVSIGPFNVSALVDYQQGGNVFNLTQLLFDLNGNAPACNNILESGISECQRRVQEWPTNTSVYIEETTYVKLRELTLSYTLPNRLVESIGGQSAQVSVSGRNLVTLTGYSGMDPEVSNFGSQAVGRSVDVAPYPPSRTFWFSFDLSF